ncbi:uncharacterized protein SPPG_07449 [Spizellomyces punctatus DAOM BR117]|uniref:Microtubule-associated protein n=1 Tax=Spizellomyces punctatus (strain DAOM BR117) TaxID=645134 RepID=A0A0L0H738_SPIPD|nr:uncharacterized protein SPPG_07449 [Spizellomyces punctatus DAOM BR117]KNC97052.1 hypothetical protein SPPG_07449 [Spizellomyces punctatus DAOM BR117]|eukprot:XP_016605092.1 hypothetical protein SPPG_07449 [Spizellomyces punctatus DAOM BR117]
MSTSSTAAKKSPTTTPVKKASSFQSLKTPSSSDLNADKSAALGTPSPKGSMSNLKGVSSKVGSLENINHTPKGGQKKIFNEKKTYNVTSKIGSLENINHVPAGGNVKITSTKLDFGSKVSPRVGSLDNVNHVPAGGKVKIHSEKLAFKEKAAPKIGSLPKSNSRKSLNGSDS